MRAKQFIPQLFKPAAMLEGVNDPAIFKAVFVIGGPGSGKSYVVDKLGLAAMGYTMINSDIAFQYLMRKHSIDPKMPPHEQEKRDIVRQRAKEITSNKTQLSIDGRLGVVIDGTGDDYQKVMKLKTNFDMLGYNNFLVVVNTSLDVARERNRRRERTVPDDIVVQSWHDVQGNIGKFSREFENVAIIDNSGTDGKETREQINQAYVALKKFTAAAPSKREARQWISSQTQVDEAAYRGNIGMMEMFALKKWTEVNSRPDIWDLMKKLIASGQQEDAWKLLKKFTGVKLKEAEKYTPASTEIRQTLRKNGYKLLGSGVDATVWAKSTGDVVKIIMPDDGQGAGSAGDTFMKFYKFCKENQGLENLPRFSGGEAEVFQADGKDYVMATMERLAPIQHGSFEEAMVWILSDLAPKGLNWNQVLATIRDERTWENYVDQIEDENALENILITFDRLDERDLLEYEVLYKLMVLLYHRGKINKIGWDLHTDNAMMRGNTIVIIDPWFNSVVED